MSSLNIPFDADGSRHFSVLMNAYNLTGLASLTRALRARYAESKRRKGLAGLLRFDDATLEDMGTFRGELIAALELPLSVDANQTLKQWRNERLTETKPFAL